jgi:hypothetical protein
MTAQASNAATVYAPNFWVNDYDYRNELGYTSDCVYNIFSLFNSYGLNYNYISNIQNSTATAYNYASITQYSESYYTNVAVFSKGHCVPWGSYGYHRQLKDWNGNNLTDSGTQTAPNYAIYPNTQGRTHFVFLWHCGTAMYYPSWQDSYGWVGFPYCWTRDNNMATDGYDSYSGSHVFLGYWYYSHQFLDSTNYLSYDYGYYCVQVFTYLLQYGGTVSAALDYGAIVALGCSSFPTCPLGYGETLGPPGNRYFSYMQIFGNGQGLGVPN